jgi:hypothetical protein
MGPEDYSPSEFIVALPVNHGGVPIKVNDSRFALRAKSSEMGLL